MQMTCRKGMAGRERTYTPRVRTSRPIGAGRTENEAPSTPLAPPKARDDAWYIPAPLSQRLHDKSALGQTTSDGGVLLTPEEVMFCHWYRHVPLPSLDWFEQEVANDATVATRTIAMDVLRNGGERVVPAKHLQKRFPSLHPMTWAIRWQRHERWQKHGGFSQIRLQRTHDEMDWDELHLWVQTVHTAGHVAELCVIDDEFDATIYHLSTTKPAGDQRLLSELSEDEHAALQDMLGAAISMDGGWFLQSTSKWPLPAFGIEHFSGRFLRNEEFSYLSRTSPSEDGGLYGTLASAGLILRPGFKYGCRWRAYATSLEVEHAPWLIQPFSEAPKTWDEVCLAVRLAEGVNKHWLCAMPEQDGYSYLNIKRSS